MKRLITLAMSVAAITCLSFNAANAQNTALQNRESINAGRLDDKTAGSNIRASQLIGANIQNSLGESVGEINDIVVDSRSGKVNYAAVTYGGFLGVGNKLFAVPFEAFKFQVDPDDRGARDATNRDYVLVLDVTQQQLEGQQGFDEDHWPNMADPQWASDLAKRYGVNRNLDAKERLLRASRERNNE